MTEPSERLAVRLRELGAVFVKIGSLSFGGPASHTAMMEEEVVRRRGWLTRERFLDYLGAANLIPSPNSTELAIHVGLARAGWPGLLVAGSAFILPATLIALALAWAYVRLGALPETAGVLYGVKPVVIVVVLRALWALGRTAVRSVRLAAVALAAGAASLLGVHELIVLGGAALAVIALAGARPGSRGAPLAVALAASGGLPLSATLVPASGMGVSLGALFGVFVKTGALLFGSGYVLLAFLRADLVARLGWLTEQQLLDAVAVGQVTPGPLFTTATFVGFLLAGVPGAAIATLGIFLPAFAFVALSGPIIPRIRRSALAGAALDGVTVASLGLMATVTWRLGTAALVDGWTVGLSLLAGVFLCQYRVNSAWLILGGGLAGVVVRRSVA